jgi:tetratricopeptide (TPR) repeat protein
MLNQLTISEYPANVRYLRARLRAVHGSQIEATRDLDLALRADPLFPSLIDFALVLYSKSGEIDRHIEKLSGWIKTMRAKPIVDWLTNSRRISQLHLLHSRLLKFDGRHAEAIAVLETAISKHEYTIDSRIDLAYLLALTETDIDRAIDMAIEMVAKRKSDPRALDTLGFAYLRDDKPLEAFKNFRLANTFAETPSPLYRFHESVALRLLGREREALDLIEGVLALDPGFPEAAEARRRLRASIGDEASAS